MSWLTVGEQYTDSQPTGDLGGGGGGLFQSSEVSQKIMRYVLLNYAPKPPELCKLHNI